MCIELHVKAQTQRGREREREREREMEKKAIFVTHIQTSTSFPLTKSAPVSLSFQLFCVATQILKKDIYICKVVCKDHNQLSQVPPWHSSLPLMAKLLVLLKPYWLSSFGQLGSISKPLCGPFRVPACRKSLNLFSCFGFSFTWKTVSIPKS